jgi:aminoglycoside phosphotransferase (APT) family kinase protein
MSQSIDSVEWVQQRLVAFIESQLPSAREVSISQLRRIPSGMSRENWVFDASWTVDGERSEHPLIMRRDPVGSVLETDREIEFAALQALQDAPLPSPRAYWMDAIGEWLGRPTILMQRCDGIDDHFVLEGGLSQLTEPARLRLARRYCETLAALHRFDWRKTGLEKLLASPGLEGAAAAIAEWEAYLFRQTEDPQPELTEVLCWLKANQPTAQATVLVHGDYKPGNTLIKDGEIQVVLDWETIHLGDPIEDLGWVTNPLRQREHLIPGVWERADLIRHYKACTGFEVDEKDLHFWNVFSNFKLNAIVLTGVRSFREGRSDRPWFDNGILARLLFQMIGW